MIIDFFVKCVYLLMMRISNLGVRPDKKNSLFPRQPYLNFEVFKNIFLFLRFFYFTFLRDSFKNIHQNFSKLPETDIFYNLLEYRCHLSIFNYRTRNRTQISARYMF